jgi:hypothetical protein
MAGQHALLSPSGASRWLACTPSARLETQFPDKAGDAASEGTLAHKLGELLIQQKAGQISKANFNKKLKALQSSEAGKKFYNAGMHEYCEDYAVYVMETFAAAKSRTKDAKLFLETQLDLTEFIPEGFGTTDVNIVADHILDVIDLKYGKGVEVSVVENKQAMVYGLGALSQFDLLYDIHTVRLHIYQPRMDNISVWEIDALELKVWAMDELIPKAQMAFAGEGEYVPGKHCQFCRARPTCKAHADKQIEIFDYDLKAARLLTDTEVSDILGRAKDLTSWLGELQDYALEQAVNNGKKWPGYKLVAGRSNRFYTDQETVATKLIMAGFPEEKIYKPKELLGITEMEKTITKKVFNAELSDLVKKPEGKPTLAPVDDERPELNSVDKCDADFAEDLPIYDLGTVYDGTGHD